VNHSLRGVEVETRMSESRTGPPLRPRPAARMARSADDGDLARRDRTSPIDLLAARYPVVRRLVGASSFDVAARRFIRSEGIPVPAFCYRGFGAMATIGRTHAVAQLGGFKASGLVAWLLWSLAHIYFLIGFRNRLAVTMNWCWNYITFQRGTRLITGISSSHIKDVTPAEAIAPTLAVNAGDSGQVLEALRHNDNLTSQESARHA
jgi:hypothetical protein